MNEEQYLFSLESRGIKLGLQRTIQLLKECGNPHKKIKIIQIIGTNGKGSTSAILSQLLQADFSVGLYTSPHLLSFQERIRVNGIPIKISEVREFLIKYKSAIEKTEASFFEAMTVMSVWYFCNKGVDYAIMETGLGGKFDSVSACDADVYGMTSISMDHMHILGSSLKAITREKVGAIKPNSIVFSAPQQKSVQSVIHEYCMKNNCNFTFINTNSKLKLSLPGIHQKENASLAINIFKHIQPLCSQKFIDKKLLLIKWFGRNQIIKESPKTVFDVAHNDAGIISFINNMKSEKSEFKNKYLLLSIQKNKSFIKAAKMINSMFDEVIYCKTNNSKSMDFSKIKTLLPQCIYIENSITAINTILKKSEKNDFIGIIGTHYWGESINQVFNISFDNL